MRDEAELDIAVLPDGTVRFVYADILAEVFDGFLQETVRASHVEPASAYGIMSNGWVADMQPVGGPVLMRDGAPFPTRAAALTAERKWLREHLDLPGLVLI